MGFVWHGRGLVALASHRGDDVPLHASGVRWSGAVIEARGSRVLEAPADSRAESIGERLAGLPATLASTVVALLGCLALTALMIGVGELLVHVVAAGPRGRWEEDVVRWFAQRRTEPLTKLSLIGSWLAETVTVVAVGLLVAASLMLKRVWRPLGLLVMSLVVEVVAYLLVTLIVERHRPFVHELEQRRPFASYPSGHTAAAFAFYFSLAVVVTALTRRRWVRVAAWTLVVVAPIVVAVSRLYRGMHHPTDVMAGYVMGVACVLIAVFAVRVGGVVADRRRAREPQRTFHETPADAEAVQLA